MQEVLGQDTTREAESLANDDDRPPSMKRVRAIISVSLATATAVIGQNLVNVGLPQIGGEFAVADAESIRVVTAFQLTLAVLVLPLAKLGEQIGFRVVFTGGLLVFGVACMGCALSRDLETLVLWRIAQGAGAGAIFGVTAALYRVILPAHLFGRGLMIHAATVAISSVLGPALAGLVLAWADWPWLFIVLAPLCVCALAIGAFALPANALNTPVPVFAAALFTLAWALFLSAFLSVSHGDALYVTLGHAAGAGLFAFLYLRHEKARPAVSRFLPLELFSQSSFGIAVITSVLNFIAQMTVLVATPFLLRDVYAASPSLIALVMVGWPAGAVLAVLVIEFAAKALSPSSLGAIGLGASAIALIVMSVAALPLEAIVAILLVCGFGFTFFFLPNNKVIVMEAPATALGAASGLVGAARLGGQMLGAALAAFCFQLGAPTNTTIFIAAMFAALGAGLCMTRNRPAPS